MASIWTVLFLPKNPRGRWARWLWAAMILVGFMTSLSVSFFFNVDGMRRSSFPPTPREKVKTAHRHQRIPQLYSFPSAYMGRNRFIGSRNHLLFLHNDVVCVWYWFRSHNPLALKQFIIIMASKTERLKNFNGFCNLILRWKLFFSSQKFNPFSFVFLPG